jgi:hypothetical protein
MKELKIIVRVNDGKIATIQQVNGYNKENLHDQLEILGILENIKDIQKEKLKTLAKGTA